MAKKHIDEDDDFEQDFDNDNEDNTDDNNNAKNIEILDILISNISIKLMLILAYIIGNNSHLDIINTDTLKLYKTLEIILDYKYKELINNNDLTHDEIDIVEKKYNKNKDFLNEKIILARRTFNEYREFIGPENKSLFEKDIDQEEIRSIVYGKKDEFYDKIKSLYHLKRSTTLRLINNNDEINKKNLKL